MSYYAFFEGLLLLSQPPSCLRISSRFPLSTNFGTLADGLGFFPLARESYHPRTDSRTCLAGIQSLIGFGTLVGALAHSVLYPLHALFRGDT